MNKNLRWFYLFTFFAFIQILVFNQLEFGRGIHIMVYPLFIFLLPYQLNVYLLLLYSFSIGFFIDIFSNTYGLHASSALVFAYLRPYVFNFFGQKEKYEVLKETNLFEMGTSWFLKVFSVLILIHHFWFFTMEIFKLNEILFVLKNSIYSFPFSIVGSLLISLLISKRKKI